MPTQTNTRIVLAARPQGRPKPSDFRIETIAIAEPGEGELLLQILYLSLDPYMRGRMGSAPCVRAYDRDLGRANGIMASGTCIVDTPSGRSRCCPVAISFARKGSKG